MKVLFNKLVQYLQPSSIFLQAFLTHLLFLKMEGMIYIVKLCDLIFSLSHTCILNVVVDLVLMIQQVVSELF